MIAYYTARLNGYVGQWHPVRAGPYTTQQRDYTTTTTNAVCVGVGQLVGLVCARVRATNIRAKHAQFNVYTMYLRSFVRSLALAWPIRKHRCVAFACAGRTPQCRSAISIDPIKAPNAPTNVVCSSPFVCAVEHQNCRYCVCVCVCLAGISART